MATYQRPPTNPVIDTQRSSRWPIVLFVVVAVLAIGGGIAYDRYVANAPIVLTPTKPGEPSTRSRPSQSTSPSTQPTRPSQSRPTPSRPTQSAGGMPEWLPLVFAAIPLVFIGIIVLVVVSWIRRVRRAAMAQMSATNPVGHWVGGQHVGTGGTANGPWARQPGTAASATTIRDVPPSEPARRKRGGFPLLPIVIGAIILDQAMFNGQYSRQALAWITQFIEGFTR
ncbi:MAG: hypothetical protein KF889_04985 [Alphaproteobacteria bacterium]|nr:hypothetical protein [Alphaproteobacteria bacterium]MCW5742224.1 hypothetical protein [Alphaproteobacteria bacterium]